MYGRIKVSVKHDFGALLSAPSMPIEPIFDRLFRVFADDYDDDYYDFFGSSSSRGLSPSAAMSQRIPGAWRQQLSHFPSSSSYEIHRDEHQVQVDVDVPGVPAKDLKVEVLNTPSCVIQWSGQRKMRTPPNGGKHENDAAATTNTFSNRLRLGPSVDCDKLAANLSHGVLRLTAPLKERNEISQIKNITVTERDD